MLFSHSSCVTKDQPPIEDYDFPCPSNQDKGKNDTSATCLINETSNHGSLVHVDSPEVSSEVPTQSKEHSSTLEHESTNGMDHTYLCEEEKSTMASQLVSGLTVNKLAPNEMGSALIVVCGCDSWRRQKNVIEKPINVSVPSCDQSSSPRLEHESQPGKALPCTEGSTMSGKLLVGRSQNLSVNDETDSILLVCGCGSWPRPAITDGDGLEAVVEYYEAAACNRPCSADETILLPTIRAFTSLSEGHEPQMDLEED